MGFFDRLFGRKSEPAARENSPLRFGDGPAATLTTPYNRQQPAATQMSADEQAIARYRYLVQSAPPEQIEQAHAEAFARLTAEQRAMVLQGLAQHTPAHEQAALSAVQDDPRALARFATRAEMRNPGTLERAFGPQQAAHGGMGMMGGMGGMIAGSLLASVAGAFIGTAIAEAMLGEFGDPLAEALPIEEPMAFEEPMTDESFADMGGDFGEEW